ELLVRSLREHVEVLVSGGDDLAITPFAEDAPELRFHAALLGRLVGQIDLGPFGQLGLLDLALHCGGASYRPARAVSRWTRVFIRCSAVQSSRNSSSEMPVGAECSDQIRSRPRPSASRMRMRTGMPWATRHTASF